VGRRTGIDGIGRLSHLLEIEVQSHHGPQSVPVRVGMSGKKAPLGSLNEFREGVHVESGRLPIISGRAWGRQPPPAIAYREASTYRNRVSARSDSSSLSSSSVRLPRVFC